MRAGNNNRAVLHRMWHRDDMGVMLRMDKYGRLRLPGRIRKALRITGSTAFIAEISVNRIELTPVANTDGAVLEKRRGLWVVCGGRRKFNAAEAVSIVRGER